MDLTFTAEQESFRQEVIDFLEAELPPGLNWHSEYDEDEAGWAFALAFTRKLGERGWIGLTWPTEYGGLGRPAIERFILWEELARANAPVVNHIGWGLAASALLAGGTHEQKVRFLPGIASMGTFWAEGLTEPDAGSDLASLRTTARWTGEHWVVNGQKTYTTWGTHADVLYLAARTDPDAPKHKGISIFCMDLGAPGVSFSPLHNIAGGRQNHTYFDDVVIPADHLIGEEGKGWDYIMGSFYAGGPMGGSETGMENCLAELVRWCRTESRYGRPLIEDPYVRERLAELAVMTEIGRVLSFEGLSNFLHARPPRFGGALGTVVSKEMRPDFFQIASEIVGPLTQVRGDSPIAPLNGLPAEWFLRGINNHAGGTPQVKRMVMATRGLGLPR
jgi:alkylation response protein AidB-like acyl-CoA dehydrogenase